MLVEMMNFASDSVGKPPVDRRRAHAILRGDLGDGELKGRNALKTGKCGILAKTVVFTWAFRVIY